MLSPSISNADLAPRHVRSLTLLLAALSMIGPFAIDTFLPSVPAIASRFGIGEAIVQQSLSVYLVAFAAMSLFYGTLSDSFGRRRTVLVALALFTVASVGASIAPTFGWLLVSRAVQGLAAGAGMVIGLAIVRDRFSGHVAHRMMSHITMVFGLAPAIAPIIGGFLHISYGWRSVFVFMTMLGLALLIASWFLLQESLPAERRVPFHPIALAKAYAGALSNRTFMARSLACGFSFGAFALYIASAPHFVMNILRLPETGFAWLFVPMIGGMVAGSSLGGRLASRLPRQRVMALGWTCMGIACTVNVALNAAFPPTLPGAVAPITLFTFGLGIAMPVMNLMTMESLPGRGGLAASLLNFMRTLIFAGMSGLIAPLLFGSALMLALGMLAAALLSAASWRFSRVPAPHADASPSVVVGALP